jgi:hypothetical protein
MAKRNVESPPQEAVCVDNEAKTVVVEHLTVTHPLVLEHFARTKAGERVEAMRKAIGLGTLALMEERLAAFLARTQDDLAMELEYLKLLWSNRELIAGTARKGVEAEIEYSDVLKQIILREQFSDTVLLTGATPEDELNKTGDILITVNDSRLPSPKLIAVESKLVGSMALGTIAKRAVVAEGDTVLSQLLEMKANRKSDEQIIVLDASTAKDSIKDEIGMLKYFEERGFVAITDRARNNFEPLRVAFLLARRMVIERSEAELKGKVVRMRMDAVNLVIESFFRNLELLEKVRQTLLEIRKQTFSGVKDLEQMQKAVQRDQQAVNKLLGTGNITPEELFETLEHAQLATEWKAREAALKKEMKAFDNAQQ